MQLIIDIATGFVWLALCGVACVAVCFCVGAVGLEIARAFH